MEVWWQTPGTNKLKVFFEYNTNLGRCIVGFNLVGAVTIRNSWKDKGISDDLLKSFWRRLWALDTSEKIKVWFGVKAWEWEQLAMSLT